MKRTFTLLLFLCLGLSGFKPDKPTYTKAELLGNIEPGKYSDFEIIKSKYASREGIYLREDAYRAFRRMWRAARKANIDLQIVSAFRSLDYQAKIWERKWQLLDTLPVEKVKNILRFSSMPGISRHHWGTDIDINNVEEAYFETEEGKQVYEWLRQNAHEFGYFQPYTAYTSFRDAGYHEEKWHWSYYPTARKFSRAYGLMVDYNDIGGFRGSEFAEELDVIEKFVFGIKVPEKMVPASEN